MKILITTDCYIPTINGVVTSTLNLETELRRSEETHHANNYKY